MDEPASALEVTKGQVSFYLHFKQYLLTFGKESDTLASAVFRSDTPKSVIDEANAYANKFGLFPKYLKIQAASAMPNVYKW